MQQEETTGGDNRNSVIKTEKQIAQEAILQAVLVFCNSVELPELMEMYHAQHTVFASQPIPLVDIKEERQYVYLHGEVAVLLSTLYCFHPGLK